MLAVGYDTAFMLLPIDWSNIAAGAATCNGVAVLRGNRHRKLVYAQ
jgi:hypothetical protein